MIPGPNIKIPFQSIQDSYICDKMNNQADEADDDLIFKPL